MANRDKKNVARIKKGGNSKFKFRKISNRGRFARSEFRSFVKPVKFMKSLSGLMIFSFV